MGLEDRVTRGLEALREMRDRMPDDADRVSDTLRAWGNNQGWGNWQSWPNGPAPSHHATAESVEVDRPRETS
jgi:hypothetical protein